MANTTVLRRLAIAKFVVVKTVDTNFIMSADDVIHVSATGFYAWKNVAISGSAGSVVMLGSYNKGLVDEKITHAVVDGLFIPMAKKTRDSANGCVDVGCFGHRTGIVGTITCGDGSAVPGVGPLDITATVENVVVAGLDKDENGEQIQQINRL